MAAVVKCECCDKVVDYKNAMHIRMYRMTSATTYESGSAKEIADVCNDCYSRICYMLNKAVT